MKRLAMVCAVLLVAAGCGDSTAPVLVATVSVSPSTTTLAVGATQQHTATVQDAGGAVLTGRSVTWASSVPSVATVTSSGLATAVAPGTATITATSEGKSGSATVIVPAFAVWVTVSDTRTGTSSTVGGVLRYTCSFFILAGATGGAPGDYAAWSYADLLYTLTSSGATSRSTVAQADLVTWFGSDRITASSPVTADRYAYWSGPFSLLVTLHYVMPSGESRASNFWLYCL